ncbi:conjugative transposon protein TraN [Echinicola marina]|uniref:DUF4138 domain-containing protein n=1 Tax=Echinicola marina TaxID=2859768 RepID=UPI001CF61A47|nr:DUF4138 domain-containing protein [Echinicola marina]UCS92423.1 conjugative transposon protein TraN [Echinicola marina]
MKKRINLILMSYCLLAVNVMAQEPLTAVKPLSHEAMIKAYPVNVGWDHTTALVFPAQVLSVDRGHAQVLAKVDGKAPNLLLLKAGKRDFVTTNLHVVTADARLYHLRISYNETLKGSSINMAEQAKAAPKALQLKDYPVDKDKLEGLAASVFGEDGFLNKTCREFKIRARLKGIYQSHGLLFFKLEFKNNSSLAYAPEKPIISIKDKKQAKHTSLKEEFMEPLLWKWENGNGLEGHGENTLVLAFPQFTISDQKQVQILLREENGDRDLSLIIRDKDILKVRDL